MFYVMVLNDGETYTTLNGCKILAIDDEWYENPELDEIVEETIKGQRFGDSHIVTAFE